MHQSQDISIKVNYEIEKLNNENKARLRSLEEELSIYKAKCHRKKNKIISLKENISKVEKKIF